MKTTQIAEELGLSNFELASPIDRMIRDELRYIKNPEKDVSILHVAHRKDYTWFFYKGNNFVAKQTEDQINQFLEEEENEYLSHCEEVSA